MPLPPVVLDSGTGSIKCGCAGVSPLPLLVCPTVLGTREELTSTHVSIINTAAQKVLPTSQTSHLSSGRCTEHASPADSRAHVLYQEVLCGDELASQRSTCDLVYPIQNGVIQSREAVQELWHHVLRQRLPQVVKSVTAAAAGGAPRAAADADDSMEDSLLLLTEAPNQPVRQRCETLELFFEDYRVRGIQCAPQGVLALFANGAERGVVLECGEGLSHCTPVFDGYVISQAQRHLNLGGRAVTDCLSQLLRDGGNMTSRSIAGGRRQQGFNHSAAVMTSSSSILASSSSVDEDVMRRLKERYCYVSVDPVHDARLAGETTALHRTCVLPDGAQCRLGAERFTAPEVLFTPQLMGYECEGVAAVLWSSIEAAEVDVRRSLYENVLLSGGTTLLEGFGRRLARELRELYFTQKAKGDATRMGRCSIAVKAPPRRQYMTFMGGALMAELTADQPEMWLSRQAYEEGGVSAIAARFL